MKTSKFFEFGFATKRELNDAINGLKIIDGEVSSYADLPAPANHNGEIWLVKTTTGVVFVNKKVAGLYVSNGTTWTIITPVEIDGYQKLITTPTDGNVVITDANGQTQNGNKKLDDLAVLGETSSTAYRGDRGKIAYDHSQIIAGNPHNTTKANVGLSDVDNTSDINKPISTATQTALNLKTTSTALRQESTRYIEKTYGSDSNNGYTLDKPFQTVEVGWNDVNPSGQVKVGGASQYDVGNFTFNALKESIKTILDEGAKIIGTINLVAGNTSMQFKGGKISATINDASGGTCYFNGVDVSGSTFNISNGGYKFIGNSTSSPASINLTGTGGTLVLQDITGGVVPLNIGAGWVVVYYNCTPAILSNSGTIIDGFNIPINSLIADQATLNVILGQTSSIYFGYYVVNFDNPVIAGMTIAKGDVFYKVSATAHIKVYTFSNAPASFSLVVSPTQRTTIVKSVDRWIVPTASPSVVDGAKINVIATDVASASTVNLDNATGDIVNITGTTAITAITLSAGIKRFVRFTGILTLTNGANLVLPSSANIVTAVGDTAIFIGYASNVVRCVSYTKADGTALVGGAGVGTDTVSTYTLDYGTGQNLNVSIDRFSIITVSNGDAFVNLPSTLNNSGKVMKIRSHSSSIGRLYINGSEKGTSKYFILGGDTAIFECDNTSWKLITGADYKVPFLGSGRQNSGRGLIFALDQRLMCFGIGDQQQSGQIYSPVNYSYTATELATLDTNGNTYTGTITGWKEILCSYENAIALTNEGEVFVWGLYWADGAGGKSRFPRKQTFPGGVIIDKVFMNIERSNTNIASFFALSTTGKLYSWGANNWGQLGLGDTTNRNNPTLITALQSKVIVKFSASGNWGFSCGAIDNTGQLYTWGYGGSGSNGSPLGNNTGTGNITTPTAISGITNASDVLCIGSDPFLIAGAFYRGHTRILRTDGSSWATGYNGAGSLAINNTTADIRVFTREAQNKTNIIKIEGGSCYAQNISCIIDADFKVYFAGSNQRGIFGKGDAIDTIQFVLNATQLSAGFQGKMYSNRGIVARVKIQGHNESNQVSCFILDGDGNFYVSGYNATGVCGDGATSDRTTFNKVKFPTNRRVVDFMPIGWMSEAGDANKGVVVVFEDGTMASWGKNTNGGLGNQIYPSNTVTNYPIYVIGYSPNDINKVN